MWPHLTFGGRYIFCQQDFSFDGGRDEENREDVLENRHHVLSKIMSHFPPCDLRRCHVTNEYHRYPSSVDVFGRI